MGKRNASAFAGVRIKLGFRVLAHIPGLPLPYRFKGIMNEIYFRSLFSRFHFVPFVSCAFTGANNNKHANGTKQSDSVKGKLFLDISQTFRVCVGVR